MKRHRTFVPARPVRPFLAWSSGLKRPVESVIALAVVIMAAPLMGAIWVAIRLTSSGGAIFAQTRLGRGGEPFTCLKFRTMRIDGRLSPAEEVAFRERYKLDNDPRVTRVGRVLRRTSLDELPQLLNVLRGDMSIVGPRPLVPNEFYEKWSACAPEVLDVRPGMTGLWQVSGRSLVSYERRIELERDYVSRQCLSMDLSIAARSVGVVLRAQGAR